jgi:mono/diheme cytochrome c family protein
MKIKKRVWPLLLLGCLSLQAAQAASPAELLAAYSASAGATADATRGQRLFVTRQGGEWSCASCHQESPVAPGRHASTGKAIDALAPGFNPRRFTDPAKAEKWFRRNCKDVLSRECTAAEKADVLSWLISLKP